jgi:CO dehydrogenase maturation factor
MPKIIVSGRGGSGKSTLVTLIANKLIETGTVLVVDADESNLGLAAMLGLEPPRLTIMGYLGGKPVVGKKLLESIQGKNNENLRLFEERMNIDGLPSELLSVSGPLRLARVGKIEHSMEGCACPMGATARAFLKRLSVGEGEWVLVDTEAGIEHFGRGLLEGSDYVVFVVDPSNEGVILARKASSLSREAGKAFAVVINKADVQSRPILEGLLSSEELPVIGVMPHSEAITRANLIGESLERVSTEVDLQSVIEEIVSSL